MRICRFFICNNTSIIASLSDMFCGCKDLISVLIINAKVISEVTDMSHMFVEYSSLSSLSDIYRWNTSKVKYLNEIFNECNLLIFENLANCGEMNI